MRKQWLYMSVAILAVFTVAVFIAINMSNRRTDSDAIEVLEQRSAAVMERVLQTRPRPAPSAPTMPSEPRQETTIDRDTVAAYARLMAEMNAANSDPEWKQAFDLIHRDQSLWDWALMAAYLDAHQDLILALRELLNGDAALFHLEYTQGYAMALPSFVDLRKVAGLLLADAALAFRRGDEATVLDNYAAFFNLTHAINQEPILIFQMMHNAILDMAYEHLVLTLRGDDISMDALQQIVHQASSTHNREGLADALAFEGLYGLEAFDSVRRGNISSVGIQAEGVDSYLWRFYGSALARPFLNMDEAAYARTMNNLCEALALPFYEAEPLLEQLLIEFDALPRTRVMTNFVTPGFGRIAHVQARREARMGLLQLGLAVEHHYGQHGAYPETLEQVAPLLGGAMPLDPYTGQPFVYEPRRHGFTLYSACRDGDIIWRGSQR